VDGDGEVAPLALNALLRGYATVLGTHTLSSPDAVTDAVRGWLAGFWKG
jgi:hypothetical protein